MELEERISRKRRRDHRLIERPRLLRALDASNARVRMLVGPAGYGKSTLAEQWTTANGGAAAWFSCRKASADVAALAIGLAEAAATVVPGCDHRLRERLAVTQNPVAEVDVLARILADDLTAWPADAWLIVDDYQHLCRTAAAELFVKLLIADAPMNLLVTSRRRPSWISSRDLVAGGVLEVTQGELAMSRDEVELALEGEAGREGIASALLAVTNGWPAIIALASVAGASRLPDEDTPEGFYDFFAEEVYVGLAPVDRMALGLLAASSVLDRRLADVVLGSARAERTITEGIAAGFLVERGGRFEFHQLARAFVEAKALSETPAEHAAAVATCMAVYRERCDWDSAYDLLERNDLLNELEGLLTDALDELLEAARLTTLEQWIEKAETASLERPIFPIAHAEVALRAGASLTSQTLAERAVNMIEPADPLHVRGLLLAGTSAHVGAREEEALTFFKRAESVASTKHDAREALWGQMMCLAELEHEDAPAVLSRLTSEAATDDPRDVVRLATRTLGFELRSGSIESLDRALETKSLLPFVSDVFVRTAFRSMLATALVLRADYEAGREVAGELVIDLEKHSLGFGLPYAFSAAAGAEAGLQNFGEAERLVALAIDLARRQESVQARLNAIAARVRILLHQGRIEEACAAAVHPRAPVPSLQGELLAVRGLAVVCSGRVEEALALSTRAANATRAVETRVLVAGISTIASIRSGAADIREALEMLLAEGRRTQAFDLVIAAYRACPDLLALLLKNASTRDESWSIVARARDHELALIVGVPLPSSADPRNLLSSREQEVYDLVCQGLSNAQVARSLFISEATAKVHLHHIFDKTGIRSRTALAVHAARLQVRQATSAISSPDSNE
jgi:ATP/maltotriose-dependent transcriptional regulator MalT